MLCRPELSALDRGCSSKFFQRTRMWYCKLEYRRRVCLQQDSRAIPLYSLSSCFRRKLRLGSRCSETAPNTSPHPNVYFSPCCNKTHPVFLHPLTPLRPTPRSKLTMNLLNPSCLSAVISKSAGPSSSNRKLSKFGAPNNPLS